MVERDVASRLRALAGQFPAITLTGPRQSGKSTLCRAVFPWHGYATLESPDIYNLAMRDPRGFLGQFTDGAILDEIQRAPELISYLQGMIDDDPTPGRWVLTGSQNLGVLKSVSQSLAGRTAVMYLPPLTWREILRFPTHPDSLDEAILTGGYPRIYDQRLDPNEWLTSYITTYIERDVRTITNVGNLTTFRRFLELCAGRTSQLLNLSQLGNDCGIAQPTVKAWLSVLEASYITYCLSSFSGSIRKRLVKMPKLHFYDTGLACRLLGIYTVDQLRSHPLRGPLFETWVASEIRKHRMNVGQTRGMFHYRDQHGVEVDLILDNGGQLSLVEAKAGQTAVPGLFDGIRRMGRVIEQAGDGLLQVPSGRTFVVYGGDTGQQRSDVTLVPWNSLHDQTWM